MAHYDHHMSLPMKAASAFGFGVALMGDVSTKEQVLIAGSAGAPAIGVSNATCAAGDPAELVVQGVAKCLAAASLGAFARVAPASTNGGLGPAASWNAVSTVGAVWVHSVGIALEPAAAGTYFAVLLDPRNF